MCMIYMGGYISGGHYNPAVSTAVLLSGRRKIELTSYLSEVVIQILGGFFGSMLGAGITHKSVAFAPKDGVPEAFFAEMFFTFILATVVLQTMTTRA